MVKILSPVGYPLILRSSHDLPCFQRFSPQTRKKETNIIPMKGELPGSQEVIEGAISLKCTKGFSSPFKRLNMSQIQRNVKPVFEKKYKMNKSVITKCFKLFE